MVIFALINEFRTARVSYINIIIKVEKKHIWILPLVKWEFYNLLLSSFFFREIAEQNMSCRVKFRKRDKKSKKEF